MLTLLVGPFLALLPQRWRSSLSFHQAIEWHTAGTLSGFAELLFAIVATLFWYSYSVTGWVSRGLDSALAGKMGRGVTDHDIGFMAIFIFATHPLTWLLGCIGVEGSVRLLSAAFAEKNLGTFPLFLLDRIYLRVTGRSAPSATKAAGFGQSDFSSYKQAVRERVRHSRARSMPDELCFTKQNDEEFLEIHASHPKPDWTPPKTVRYQDAFYRLEATADGAEPRPYHYRLRRLSAGVMGRTVLIYAPEGAQLLVKK
jgi:hypothetical protein